MITDNDSAMAEASLELRERNAEPIQEVDESYENYVWEREEMEREQEAEYWAGYFEYMEDR